MKKFTLILLVIILAPGLVLAQGSRSNKKIQTRYVKSKMMNVYEQPNKNSSIVATLQYLDSVSILLDEQITTDSGVWLKIIAPMEGYIFQKVLVSGSIELGEGKDATGENQLSADNDSGMEGGMEKNEASKSTPAVSRDVWMGGGLGVFVMPHEQGYSSAVLSTQEFIVEFADDGNWQSNMRFGASLTNLSGTNLLTALNIYGAYRYDFGIHVFSGFDFYALGGLFLSLTNISGNLSGSSTGYGAIVGFGSYYDLSRHGFSKLMRGGFQVTFHSGNTAFGTTSQKIGVTQLQVFAVWDF